MVNLSQDHKINRRSESSLLWILGSEEDYGFNPALEKSLAKLLSQDSRAKWVISCAWIKCEGEGGQHRLWIF
jgi:hypothetical protein